MMEKNLEKPGYKWDIWVLMGCERNIYIYICNGDMGFSGTELISLLYHLYPNMAVLVGNK
jgi:hypothetical protein